jgi:hypothetical protein
MSRIFGPLRTFGRPVQRQNSVGTRRQRAPNCWVPKSGPIVVKDCWRSGLFLNQDPDRRPRKSCHELENVCSRVDGLCNVQPARGERSLIRIDRAVRKLNVNYQCRRVPPKMHCAMAEGMSFGFTFHFGILAPSSQISITVPRFARHRPEVAARVLRPQEGIQLAVVVARRRPSGFSGTSLASLRSVARDKSRPPLGDNINALTAPSQQPS